jgi:hypothetical protein
MNNENIPPENIYKCLFYAILFIFLTIIIIKLLKKSKKEKYSPAYVIQINSSEDEVSRLNTGDIVTTVNNIISNFTNTPLENSIFTGNTTVTGNTTFTGTNTNIDSLTFGSNATLKSDLNISGNINTLESPDKSIFNLSDKSSIICTSSILKSIENFILFDVLFDKLLNENSQPDVNNYLYLNNMGEIGYHNNLHEYTRNVFYSAFSHQNPTNKDAFVPIKFTQQNNPGFKINGREGYMSINTNLTNFIEFRDITIPSGGSTPYVIEQSTWSPYQFIQSDSGISILKNEQSYTNTGGSCRSFVWTVDQGVRMSITTQFGRLLGLFINITNDVGPDNFNSTNYNLFKYFLPEVSNTAFSFTGEHSSMVCNEEYNKIMNSNEDMIGLIVCSSGEIYNLPYNRNGDTYKNQIDNIKPIDSQPMSCLSNKYKDKRVLGVISSIENQGKREDTTSSGWTGVLAMDNDGRKRIRVASIGEGGMWITNEYGNLENGDYICSSNISGYGCLQNDDITNSYTVAKILMDCDFNTNQNTKYKTRKLGYFNNKLIVASYVAVTFHCG